MRAALAHGRSGLVHNSMSSTETAPAALFANWPMRIPGNVGLPVPGVELKLVPRPVRVADAAWKSSRK